MFSALEQWNSRNMTLEFHRFHLLQADIEVHQSCSDAVVGAAIVVWILIGWKVCETSGVEQAKLRTVGQWHEGYVAEDLLDHLIDGGFPGGGIACRTESLQCLGDARVRVARQVGIGLLAHVRREFG